MATSLPVDVAASTPQSASGYEHWTAHNRLHELAEFYVEAYGSVQEAATALETNGSGRLIFKPGKTYTLTSSLTCNASNVVFSLNGAKIVHSGSTYAITPGNTTDYTTLTYYTLSGTSYVAGTTVITLNSSSDNVNFTAGDYVYVRTRQVVSGGTAQPVAEINQILSISGANLTLRWPLAKDYTKDASYTWGVANCTSIVQTNWLFEGPGEINTTIRSIVGLNLVGCMVRGIRFTGRSGLHLRGRFLRVEGCDFDITPDWSATLWRPGFVFIDTGTAYFWIERNNCRSIGVGFMHLHEGSANGWVRDNSFLQPSSESASTEDWPVISIRALSWNLHIVGNTIINQARASYHGILALQSGVYTGEGNKDLVIADNIFRGTFNGWGIDTNDTGVQIRGNQMANGTFTSGSIQSTGAGALVLGNVVPTTSTTISGTGTLVRSNINITDSA